MNIPRILTALSFFVLTTGAAAQVDGTHPKKKCRLHCQPTERKIYYPESDRRSGETLRGPRTVIARDLNTLRYEYIFTSVATYQQTPDAWTKLTNINPIPQPSAPNVKAPSGSAPSRPGGNSRKAQLPQDIQDLIDRVITIENEDGQRIQTIDDDQRTVLDNQSNLSASQRRANAALVSVDSAGANLISWLTNNTTGVADQLIPQIDARLADPIFLAGTTSTWPSFDEISTVRNSSEGLKISLSAFKPAFDRFVPKQTASLELVKHDILSKVDGLKKKTKPDTTSINALTETVDDIETEETRLTDAAALLQWETSQNDAILTALPELESASPKYATFQKSQTTLKTWKTKLESTKATYAKYPNGDFDGNPFQKQTTSDCEFAFGGGKTIAITLARRDLTPGSDPKNSETVLSLTVQCTSPISFSAGVAFSTIGVREFAIQPVPNSPGSTTTTNRFVVSSQSSFHPLPLGMVHTRLCEFNDSVSVHFTFGLAGNIKGQNSGGSSAEFLLGPSLALFRTVFLTPGLHIGQKAMLSGFNVGDPVPSNVTSPPLRTSYVKGFGFAITFTKP